MQAHKSQTSAPETASQSATSARPETAAHDVYNAHNGSNGSMTLTRIRFPRRVELPVVQPWPDPVNGEELLNEILRVLERFVVFPKWAAPTVALWIMHTFAFRLREITTYLGIESPEKECGKSTLLTVLSQFVDRPAVSSNVSPSAFYRVIEELEPTFLIDEADTNLRGRDELTGIFNAGYTSATGFVWRISYDPDFFEPEEDNRERRASGLGHVVRYSTWCPKAIATIGHLEPTLASRCIVIRMHRKMPGEESARLKLLDARDLRRKCARFVADHADAIATAEPAIPDGLTNRAADIWEPLLILADLAGGRWPKFAREAAQGLTARAHEYSPIGSLLMDIFIAFTVRKTDRLFSRDLVAALENSGDRPWVELRKGKPLTENWLSRQLRPYGITPRSVRIGDHVAKGYFEAEMLEVFRRYIPRSEVEALRAEFTEEPTAESTARSDLEEASVSI